MGERKAQPPFTTLYRVRADASSSPQPCRKAKDIRLYPRYLDSEGTAALGIGKSGTVANGVSSPLFLRLTLQDRSSSSVTQ